ncbi:hypothetical protein ACTXHA_16060 [Burkholderia cenocepacia]
MLVAKYDQDEASWSLILFVAENVARVDIYSLLHLDLEQFDRLRVLEAMNHVNYSYLYESHLELSPPSEPPRLRLKSAHIGSGALVNPVEFISSYNRHTNLASAWLKMLKVSLASTRPVIEAVDDTWKATIVRKG